MNVASFIRTFAKDCRGASAAEFIIVLPVLTLLIFGMIDVGMFAWKINTLEKATQAGARYAIVTNPVAANLANANYVGLSYGGTTINQGDAIPAGAYDKITCTSTACTCATSTFPPCSSGGAGFTAASFTSIVDRMKVYDNAIQPGNVVVEYTGSGLGFAGDPSGMDPAPMVTVRLKDSASNGAIRFSPLTGFLFSATGVSLPSFAYSLTMEDGSGTRSN